MLSDLQDSSSNYKRLFHVSEEADISVFEPRPSPSFFEAIKGDVVFAISEALLHNYLLPRDCPRVTFYATAQTTLADRVKFIGPSIAKNVIVVESGWYQRIKNTTLYCYEFVSENFTLLDGIAGYYVSYRSVAPLRVWAVSDIIGELLNRNIELRFTPSLIDLADEVARSSMGFSLIRMRNAIGFKKD